MSRNRRRSERIKANNLVTYSVRRTDRLYKLLGLAVALDLSDSGLRVRTNEALPLGEELHFSLQLGGHLHDVAGRVLWGSELDADKLYEFGIRFKEVDLGLARDLWKLTEGALSRGPAERSDEKSGVAEPALEKLLAVLAKALGPEDGATALGPEEREVLRGLLARTAKPPGTADVGAARPAPNAEPAAEDPPRASVPREHAPPLLEAVAMGKRSAITRTGAAGAIRLTLEPPSGARPFLDRRPTPRPQGMVGHFEGDELIEFVQMLGVQCKTGVLEVMSESGGGHLAFREGKVIAARTQTDAGGEVAALEILALGTGHFDFWPHPLASVATEHALSVPSLVLEVARRRDHQAPPAGDT